MSEPARAATGWLGDVNGREFYQTGQRSMTFYGPDRLAADTLQAS